MVIAGAVRTPIGRGHLANYKHVHPSTLLARVYEVLDERTAVDPAETADVLADCVLRSHQLAHAAMQEGALIARSFP